MTKFIINGSTTGKGSSQISVSPNPSNDPTQVNSGLIKIYRVTQGSSGNTIKSLKKTIALLQKAKTTDTGGGSTGGGEEDNPKVTVYRIEIYEPEGQFRIWAQAPNGKKELSLTIIGISTEKMVCQCYSATMDKRNGVIDVSTKAKTPMGIRWMDVGININQDGMADSIPLKDSYFTINNTINVSREVDIKIYPEIMAHDLSQYAITLHLTIVKDLTIDKDSTIDKT